jgi:hypothetical protein
VARTKRPATALPTEQSRAEISEYRDIVPRVVRHLYFDDFIKRGKFSLVLAIIFGEAHVETCDDRFGPSSGTMRLGFVGGYCSSR